jgi:four helix bundle protein
MGDFKSLIVWQKSVALVTDIYQMTESFPKNEAFGLTSQIRRAAVSIPSNIAEGHSRRSTLDYIQFLKISRGSLAELETQLLISKNLNFISENNFLEINEKLLEIAKMLNSLITKLNPKS